MGEEYILPPVQVIKSLPEAEQKEILNHLFEKCETLTGFLIPLLFEKTTGVDLKSYPDLISKSKVFLLDFINQFNETQDLEIKQKLDRIIGAHPRLGPPKPTAGDSNTKLSVHSSKEQASLSSNGDPKLAQALSDLNDEYEAKFPGLKYVVFVNGRSREVIMANMRQRIKRGDINLERIEAIQAMCDIALDRANKLTAKL